MIESEWNSIRVSMEVLVEVQRVRPGHNALDHTQHETVEDLPYITGAHQQQSTTVGASRSDAKTRAGTPAANKLLSSINGVRQPKSTV